MEEQLSLNFEKVAVSEGDRLLVVIAANGYRFINEAGFATHDPLEGSLIETLPFSLGMCVNMPACRGILFYTDMRPLFYPFGWRGTIQTDKSHSFKLWNNDEITILKTPKLLSQAR